MLSCDKPMKQKSFCCLQGFSFYPIQISNKGGLFLDSLIFGSAMKIYSLRGDVMYNNKKYPYTIFMENDPRSDISKVLKSEFPLKDIDSSEFACEVNFNKNKMEITWANNEKRLFVSNIISAN
jgi:hypothetical protein